MCDRGVNSGILDPSIDPWLAADKLQHFLVCGLIAFSGFLSGSLSINLHRYRLAAGAILGCSAGAAKELGDFFLVRAFGKLSHHRVSNDPFGTFAMYIQFFDLLLTDTL